MVKIEQNRQQHRKRNSKEYIADIDIPEMNQPRALFRREKRFASWQSRHLDIPHVADMNKPSKEHNGQGRAIILQKLANPPFEETAITKLATNPAAHKHQQGDHDTEVRGSLASGTPLPGEDLDTLLKVDEGDIETEDVARETGDISETITSIGNGKQPMHDQRPSTIISTLPKREPTEDSHPNPTHKRQIIRPSWRNDIINRVIKHSNRTYPTTRSTTDQKQRKKEIDIEKKTYQ